MNELIRYFLNNNSMKVVPDSFNVATLASRKWSKCIKYVTSIHFVVTIPSIHVLTLSLHIIAALISRSLFLIPYIATRAVPNCVNSSHKIANVLSVTYFFLGIRTLVVYLEGIEPSHGKNLQAKCSAVQTVKRILYI